VHARLRRTAAIRAAFYYSVAIVRSRDSCVRKGLILSCLISPVRYVWRARVAARALKMLAFCRHIDQNRGRLWPKRRNQVGVL